MQSLHVEKAYFKFHRVADQFKSDTHTEMTQLGLYNSSFSMCQCTEVYYM